MALSALGLLNSTCVAHLEASAEVTDLVSKNIFHGRADIEAPAPYVLYRLPKLDHGDASRLWV